MAEKNKTLALLILDLIGTLLFAVGAMGEFGATGIAPLGRGTHWVLMTVGIALILPYFLHVIAKGRQPN